MKNHVIHQVAAIAGAAMSAVQEWERSERLPADAVAIVCWLAEQKEIRRELREAQKAKVI